SKNGKIAISGWTEQSDADIVPFINGYVNEGVRQVISTDINVDGMLTGPSTALYKRILDEVEGVHLIASGGVGSIEHIVELAQINVPEVIVGKAIYENKISLNDIKRINRGELC
ncbi:MAG: 1-(5-phosphoribosyl)-5-[(5-phosphoribosylamino)methylideneamino]imidazole-4-carboxamide isomerase, partial [Muribaculaceae bacterium]|nr:1-(5-phosphoribosyl)-5-[(5-phosphoribosylamino)methylideneamino]imidazole-4-carboxamide isomerase [Muribaculaceae bacterium]